MNLLAWVAPPVVGAVIGFVTNDIAIRMLFRPLREYRVLGLRIPFTPGIIPRRRHELATAIGRMVSEELVTAQTLGAYLSRDSARHSFRQWVSRATAKVLDTPIADMAQPLGSAESGTGLATDLLEGFLQSERFGGVVRVALETVFVSLEGASLSSIAGEGDAAAAIARALIRLGRDSPDLAAVEATVKAARVLAAPAGREIGRWLAASPLRPEIERRARDLLRSALEKLSPFQRIVVHAAKYDRRLEEKLPEIVDESVAKLGDLLSDPATQDALAAAVRSALEKKPGAPTDRSQDGDGGAAPQLQEALVDVVAAWLRPLMGRPLMASVRDLAGSTNEQIVETLAARIAERARIPGTAARILEALRNAARHGGGEGRVGDLLGIGEATKKRLDTLLADGALDLLRGKLEDLLAGLDIRAMVVQRIDGLDVADVEKLLMMVIARHLKWINVFGAILGFLIGIVQAVLNSLT